MKEQCKHQFIEVPTIIEDSMLEEGGDVFTTMWCPKCGKVIRITEAYQSEVYNKKKKVWEKLKDL